MKSILNDIFDMESEALSYYKEVGGLQGTWMWLTGVGYR